MWSYFSCLPVFVSLGLAVCPTDWPSLSLSLFVIWPVCQYNGQSVSWLLKSMGCKKKKKNSAFFLFRVVLTWLSMCILHSFCLLLWLFSINFFSSRNINSRTFRQHVMLSILLLSLTFFLSVSRGQFALCFKLRNQKMFFLISGKQRAIWRKIFIAMCLRWQRKES